MNILQDAFFPFENVKFDDKGLVPAIAQDYISGKIYMMGYMNAESLKLTLETKKATFFSRSRQKLWVKGEHSGSFLNIHEILVDCDIDTINIIATTLPTPQHPPLQTHIRFSYM